MTTTEARDNAATDTLAAVARLLNRAADMASRQSRAYRHSTHSALAVGALLAARQALALLPEDAEVDEPVPVESDPVRLLHAAEELTRAHPIEAFPPGTSQLIVAICDLIRESPS